MLDGKLRWSESHPVSQVSENVIEEADNHELCSIIEVRIVEKGGWAGWG